MKYLRILIAAVVATLGGATIAQVSTASPSDAPTSGNPNEASYWAERTEHPSVCYKFDPPTEPTPLGALNEAGTAVVLSPFHPTWGTHWELLVVKSGSVDNGDGAGNIAYHHPQAGVEYFGPLNGGGQQGAVSHWIVCKGQEPQPESTTVKWVVTNGDCESPLGTLFLAYDKEKVVYTGSEAGEYPAGSDVTGTFTAQAGYEIEGPSGPFSHTFTVDGAPCETPADLVLQLTAECAVGDVLYWRVTNTNDVDVDFTWDGPGAEDGSGVATAGTTTYFTTTDAGDANTTIIRWTNPSGGTSETVKAHNNEPCTYHVTFEKDWQGDAPDLDGAVLLTAESSIGSATCTSDDGELTCSYLLGEQPADDLHVPFGETYAVTEVVPSGWYVVTGTGSGFTGIDGFDPSALPAALVLDVADDRACGSAAETASTSSSCIHVVKNAPTTGAPAPQFVDPTCADRSVAVVDPNTEDDITYEVVSGEVAPGEQVTVRAVAAPGTVLEGTNEWTHTFGEIEDADCVTQGVPGSSIDAECGSATLTFTNTVGELEEGYTGAPIEFTYTVDGSSSTVIVAAGDTETIQLDFDEDSGSHSVAIAGGDSVVVESNCEPDPVTPEPPTFTDPTCEAPDASAVGLPTVEGIVYTIDGTPAPGATVTVTAVAEDGFVLDGTSEWEHTFDEVSDELCSPPVEPTIDVAAFSPVCQADIPYISYRIEVTGTDSDRATLTFIDNTGAVIRVDEDVPLVGTVIYPGAADDPNPDWPGWRLNEAGFWVPDPTDDNWRDGLTVRVEVNPTAEGQVTYPAATEVCNSPERQSSGGPTTTTSSTTTTVASSGQLPNTGSGTAGFLVTLGLGLMLLGTALAGAVRFRRPV